MRSRQRAKLRKRELEADAAFNIEANAFLSFWQPVIEPEKVHEPEPEPEPVQKPEPVQVPEPIQVPEPVLAPKYEPWWRKLRGVSIWNEGRHRNDRHKPWHLPCFKDFEIIVLGKI